MSGVRWACAVMLALLIAALNLTLMPMVISALPATVTHRPQCVAHRGMRDRFPENTVLAFERALASGANGLELDLRLTSDNQLIVFHDETLSAASNGTWFVRRRPWRDYVEWVRVKLGRRELTEERVPLFEWVVPVLKRYPGTSVLIDVKDSNDVEILDKLKEVLAEHDPYATLKPRITIGIWDERFWFRARTLFGAEGYRLSFITKSLRQAVKVPFLGGVDNFNLNFEVVKLDRNGLLDVIRRAIDPSVTIYGKSWTINEEDDMRLAMALRFDAILTDHIELCRKVVDEEGLTAWWSTAYARERFVTQGQLDAMAMVEDVLGGVDVQGDAGIGSGGEVTEDVSMGTPGKTSSYSANATGGSRDVTRNLRDDVNEEDAYEHLVVPYESKAIEEEERHRHFDRLRRLVINLRRSVLGSQDVPSSK